MAPVPYERHCFRRTSLLIPETSGILAGRFFLLIAKQRQSETCNQSWCSDVTAKRLLLILRRWFLVFDKQPLALPLEPLAASVALDAKWHRSAPVALIAAHVAVRAKPLP